MYEIHINASKIYLIKSAFAKSVKKKNNTIVAKYNGKVKSLLNYIDKAEKAKEDYKIYIHNTDVNKLKEDFFSLFKIIKAGGGLVLNEKAEILMIFRRGSWDLPKGKKEKGEKRKETAIREVIEETGIENVEIINPLPDTYHTYKLGKQRVIKLSYWYLMETKNQLLIPQVEEDIEKAEWIAIDTIQSGKCVPIYENISNLLNYYFRDLKKHFDI